MESGERPCCFSCVLFYLYSFCFFAGQCVVDLILDAGYDFGTVRWGWEEG